MQILLTDFGFCKPVAVDYKGKVTLSKTFCGSAAYAAPETLLGNDRPRPQNHSVIVARK